MVTFDEPGPGPAVSKRQLCAALRRLREERQLTQDQVAQALEWSLSKVQRIESGTNTIAVTDLHALLRLYEVDDAEQVTRLVDWTRRARHGLRQGAVDGVAVGAVTGADRSSAVGGQLVSESKARINIFPRETHQRVRRITRLRGGLDGNGFRIERIDARESVVRENP